MRTHYEVLEVKNDAELVDIKKAYRRLALQHHPDRNNGSAASTERFKRISEAYTILSDPAFRKEYDLSLRLSPSPTGTQSHSNTTSLNKHQGVKDPFQQFDDLFRNDPFFHDAFQGMDDEFAKRFESSKANVSPGAHKSVNDEPSFLGSFFNCGIKDQDASDSVPWYEWLMNKLGVELSVTSVSQEVDGSVLATSYTSKPGTSYTSKKSRTYVENGKQVNIMSMEKNGNKIEDKFVEGELVERRVNGVLEPVSQISN